MSTPRPKPIRATPPRPNPTPIAAPLQFLPAFELSARYLSFKRAAEELHLTPSAISQQIRALEDALGLKLFKRVTRAVHLTEAGEQFAAVVGDTLETYRRGTDRLLRRYERRVLRLSTDAFVAHELLIPALHTFAERVRGVELRIETGNAFADLRSDGVDAAVRFGRGPWPGLVSATLSEAFVTPVCAPGLVKSDRLRSPRALARYPLIRLRDQPDPWARAAEALGFELSSERIVLDNYFATVRAAEKGVGIALGAFPATSAAVLEGRLVTPLPIRVRTQAKYSFVCRKEDAEHPTFVALREGCAALFAALPRLPEPHGCVTLDEPA
jgi:LysR family transcriptional regulator, glycine cleavage system transcriptional activator